MKTKLKNLIDYFTPTNDDHIAILSTFIAFILYWVGIYITCFITNL